MKAKQLINIAKTVTEIMETDVQTRNSDSLLYLRVLQKATAATTGTERPVSPRSMSVDYFLKNMKDLGFPPFESVRRARQMIQSKRPDLRANERVEVGRIENEKEYRAFARGGVTV